MDAIETVAVPPVVSTGSGRRAGPGEAFGPPGVRLASMGRGRGRFPVRIRVIGMVGITLVVSIVWIVWMAERHGHLGSSVPGDRRWLGGTMSRGRQRLVSARRRTVARSVGQACEERAGVP